MGERVRLGEQYRDTVTGYRGTATARTEVYGSDVANVKIERGDSTGKPEDVWLWETRLEPVCDAPAPGQFA